MSHLDATLNQAFAAGDRLRRCRGETADASRRALFFALALVVAVAPQQAFAQSPPAAAPIPGLAPTNHPRLPSHLSDFWMVPDERPSVAAEIATAIRLLGEARADAAFGILSRSELEAGPLEDYVAYYRGVAELDLGRPADALRTFQRLQAEEPTGYLAEAAARREGETHEVLGNEAAAVAIYERLSTIKTTAPSELLMNLGRAAKQAGDEAKAIAAFSRVYFEYPTSDAADAASTELDALPGRPALTAGSQRYTLELARAERLLAVRSIANARAAFELLRKVALPADRDLLALRLAECDYFQKRSIRARDALKTFAEGGFRRSEALFYYASVLRNLKAVDAYVRTVRRLADEFPAEPWTEEALNDLASHYIIADDDASADAALRELYQKFPKGRFAERAAWKIGWLAYKKANFTDTVRFFESGATSFPRSDYRPAWLFWSARAHEALKETDLAQARYATLLADYSNTYYGRLGAPRLTPAQWTSIQKLRAQLVAPAPPDPPRNRKTIGALIALELYDQALDELRYAQTVWGDSPSLQATLGFVYNRKGDVRAGINAVKRAYPQYMTAGGEKLPLPLLQLIYPLEFWPEIQRYSNQRGLDPYMIAALILQESNFDPAVRSSANAYGLMQLLPSTGRSYARRLKLTNRFTIGLLTTAEPNLNMGTAYFADLLKQFGGAHFALASYNAGERRVSRWMALSPDAPRDEFIEDIPFFETSNYVKRILGTMEDYRRLYGSKPLSAGQH
jgi:soluble lytic murein transglycosylase